MTEAEAKEYMENEIRCIQRASYCDRDCAKCNLVKEEEPLLEAFGMAINALEKQIAKKPKESVKFGVTVTIRCANCNITSSFYEGFEFDYCPYCGQKLDWSEV